MSILDDKTLERYHDDDLSAEERRLVEERLAAAPEDRQRLASLGQLRTLLQGAVERGVNEADLEGLWDRLRDHAGAVRRATAWERLCRYLGASMGAHPIRWVAVGASVAILAVVVTLLVLPRPGAERAVKPAVEATRNQLDIEALDFKGRHPDIFQIREGERSTTVIWVHPDDEEEPPEDPRTPAGGPEDI